MTRWLAGVAIAAAAAVPMAAPAAADPICVGVDKVGTFGPPLTVGPVCVPYGGATHCRYTDIGITPTLLLRVYTCVPR